VIHREIRPNEIMVSDDAQAKLADLGLTKDEHTRFLDGENAYYVAPEQIRTRDVDTRADIYSLGCCLFHCMTGEPPFEGGGPKDVLQRRLTAPVPNAQELNPEVPAELASIVMKMMARDAKDRYQTPAEVADALKKVQLTPPTRGVKPTTPKFAKRPLRPGMRPRPGQRPTSGRLGAKGRYGSSKNRRYGR
jgi:serine/threonine-protein kinase